MLLISMPYGALERPALGLSLLKAVLAERSIACDVQYFTFPFADFLGCDEYQWISSQVPYTAFAGDWTFTGALYAGRPAADKEYIREVLLQTWKLHELNIGRIMHVRALAQPFLDYCMEAVPWSNYAIVGFTSTFEQNIASLALARRIKLAYPGIRIVFGGANWEGEMGVELHRRFPFVDYVCSGESEKSFPALVEGVLRRPRGECFERRIPGIVYRASGKSVDTGPAEIVRDLDSLPIPDFSDYFRALEESAAGAAVVPTLLFESSRGCWWGAKSHCTFCGLNGQTMAFRSKGAARVLQELSFLVERWQTELVEAVDNILDMKYFQDVLPALARSKLPLQLFYEVKSNLTRRQVELLCRAGVDRIQPGIESLSDHVLRLMRKGTTALRNIQLLKWCKEYDVHVDWNILYGFPGETPEDYAEIMRLLPSIRFLSPPTAWGPIRLDRFSPYHDAPASFGMANVRPLSSYKFLYPFDSESLSRIAYYFDFNYAPGSDPTGYASQVIAYVDSWQKNPERGSLNWIARVDGTLALIDTRSDATVGELVLSGLEQAAYEYCDELRPFPGVLRYLREAFPGVEFSEQDLLAFLDSLVANRLMVTDGKHYLSLAVRTPPLRTGSEGGIRLPAA